MAYVEQAEAPYTGADGPELLTTQEALKLLYLAYRAVRTRGRRLGFVRVQFVAANAGDGTSSIARDFALVAADQVFNQIAKARHMFGGETRMPFVLRTKCAIGTGYGSQHSMDPVGIFATSPGWRIAAASTPFDYVGLMNSALACKDPVLVIEHVDLYNSTGAAPVEDLDYIIPVGKAAVRRKGRELTVLTYLSMVNHSMEAVDQTGIDAEVIDLRWLDRASLDWDTIATSIKKTNNVLIVEQGARGTSYGAWLADEIQRRYFDWLDQPVQRVTGAEASPSISKVLERAACARTEEVVDGLRQVMRDKGLTNAGSI